MIIAALDFPNASRGVVSQENENLGIENLFQQKSEAHETLANLINSGNCPKETKQDDS